MLAQYIVPHRWLAFFLGVGLLAEAGFESGLRLSFKFLIDEAILPRDYVQLVLILLLLACGAFALTLICLVSDFLWARFGSLVINRIRQSLFDHVQGLSIEFFGRRSSGDILNCFLADASTVENSLVSALPAGLLALSNILLSGVLMFALNWPLSVLSYLGLMACFLAPRWLNQSAMQASYRLRQQEGTLAGVIQENILTQSIVKLFGLEQHRSNQFSNQLDRFMDVAVRANFLAYLSQRIPYLIFTLLNLVVLGIGAAIAYLGAISMGTLVSYQVLFLGLSSSISNLTWVLPTLIDGSAGMQRIQELLSEVPQVEDLPDAAELPRLCQEIRFEQVRFSYTQERPGLKDISFRLRSGEFALFVGPSGAGKSTIVNLLTRFYDPDAGRILFDGIDLREVSQRSLRAQIGLVTQDVVLFNCSLRENIRMGDLSATDKQVEVAAKAAAIHDFILTLPQGYDTPAGEKGLQMSGGQRQRLSLARALIRNPSLLILDEATSALDPISEAIIFNSIELLRQDHTIISVTHRLNQAKRADIIFVLKDGQIVETGQHDQLLAQKGLYTHLWQQSSKATYHSLNPIQDVTQNLTQP